MYGYRFDDGGTNHTSEQNVVERISCSERRNQTEMDRAARDRAKKRNTENKQPVMMVDVVEYVCGARISMGACYISVAVCSRQVARFGYRREWILGVGCAIK